MEQIVIQSIIVIGTAAVVIGVSGFVKQQCKRLLTGLTFRGS